METILSKSTRAGTTLSRHATSNFMGNTYIFAFENGDGANKHLLGGKGAALVQMTRAGLPVPPGFTITTETCSYFLSEKKYPEGYVQQFEKELASLEKKLGKKFGGAENPLLVSVRSGAAVSMPGMMDTVLNLGLNEETLKGLIAKTGNERFSYDAYRRFIQMFGNVVMGMNHHDFEHELEELKKQKGVSLDTELDARDLKKLIGAYKKTVKEKTGKDFPEDPREQLKMAIEAVFDSWNNKRAITYRRINKITGLMGTAVTVQAMVFGNMGETSGTGVAFTRNPSTGEKEFYGEFLMNAQGEDVVAGIRTPRKIEGLESVMPEAYKQLIEIKDRLEQSAKNMQDIEFTIEEGKLFILQTRNGKRSGRAALKIAVDLVNEGLITKEEALLQVDPELLNHLLHPAVDPKAPKKLIAKGMPASPGAACGKVVFTADDAVEWNNNGEKVILVRKETSPEDIHGMHDAQGILTSVGGLTSHAALVARGMGKPCIVGASKIHVDVKRKVFVIDEVIVKEGDIITIDGSCGEVYVGSVPTIPPEMTGEFKTFMQWADKARTLRVRVNADTPKDAKLAREFGAEGIGLCRTEHMFFEEDRIPVVREMILCKDETARRAVLEKLKPMQKSDFVGIFEATSGYPVTIRLLDPPLHEFLPQEQAKIKALATQMGMQVHELEDKISQLHEVNPMLGHRGCRLAVTHPEIYEMQVEAIVEAGIEVSKKEMAVAPEIEVPLVCDSTELSTMRKLIENVIAKYSSRLEAPHGGGDGREVSAGTTSDERNISNIKPGTLPFEIKIGTMIELPRACVTADALAHHADFFSFGTNDLTQTTFGLSRDDSGKFLPDYLEKGIFQRDPTETIDQKGVGELMKICVKLGRTTKPDLEIGICGEHGGEPKSIEFCHAIGLNYVSCSPFRVPIARLAAAQAALKGK